MNEPKPVREGPGWKQWGDLGPLVGTRQPVDTGRLLHLVHEYKMDRLTWATHLEFSKLTEEAALQLREVQRILDGERK